MVKVSKKVSKKKTTVKKNKPNYKWDTWLNGRNHTLKAGKDFTCTAKSFAHYMRKRGIVAGKKVEIEYMDNGDLRVKAAGKYTGVQTNPLQTGKKTGTTAQKTTKKKTTKKKVSKKTKKKAKA